MVARAVNERIEDAQRRTWPLMRFEGTCSAAPEAVYDLLADLPSHLEWAGRRQSETFRLLTMEAPPGPASVGTEFHTTGADGKSATWTDRSVVTEAIRPVVFEFVTEGRRDGKPGTEAMTSTAIHRYEVTARPGGSEVTYSEELTRFNGPAWVIRAFRLPVVGPALWRMSAKYMRKGFDNLLALAEERAVETGTDPVR
jgi:hypothetical protein